MIRDVDSVERLIVRVLPPLFDPPTKVSAWGYRGGGSGPCVRSIHCEWPGCSTGNNGSAASPARDKIHPKNVGPRFFLLLADHRTVPWSPVEQGGLH